MTTFAHCPVPAPGSPLWREIYPTPHDVRFDVGPFCPIDDTHLHSERQSGLPGWVCPTCLAWWDLRGRNGQWLTDPLALDGQVVDADPAAVARLRRVDRWTAAAIGAGAVCGLGYSTGRAMRPHEHLVPDELVWALAGLLAAAGAVAFGVLVLLRWWDARRYAGNELLGPGESDEDDR